LDIKEEDLFTQPNTKNRFLSSDTARVLYFFHYRLKK